MLRIIGYGEDALTYWALTEKIEYVLQELKDRSNPSDCLLIYRPSFSRGGSSAFGEFDAILATSEKIYLIESKWDGTTKVKNGIKLKKEQINRHKIFCWYFNWWKKDEFQSWSSFIETYKSKFQSEFEGKEIAPLESKLRRNLEYVLGQLDRAKEMQSVILFFYSKGSSPPSAHTAICGPEDEDLHEFTLVPVEYSKLDNGDYFEFTKSRIV